MINQYTLWISLIATAIALSSLAYQIYRDFLSEKNRFEVLFDITDNKLSVAVINLRRPAILKEIGMISKSDKSESLSKKILSNAFDILSSDQAKLYKDLLPFEISGELNENDIHRIYIELATGEKFYSRWFSHSSNEVR